MRETPILEIVWVRLGIMGIWRFAQAETPVPPTQNHNKGVANEYWRMQLHPADPQHATKHTVESLAKGYIGLDWDHDPGDLTKTKKEDLPKGERRYLLIVSY